MSLSLCCGPSAPSHSRQQGEGTTAGMLRAGVGSPEATVGLFMWLWSTLMHSCLPLTSLTARSQIHFAVYSMPQELGLVGGLGVIQAGLGAV